ncbi:MAG TPA: hypothetical protein PKZ97_13470 [Azospirillaceae bacterium]|nr:hypothetical protein [Azospirillaceae bacterium]HRQ82116.1 hypothetical protein [Azospirillaceae bacterium]
MKPPHLITPHPITPKGGPADLLDLLDHLAGVDLLLGYQQRLLNEAARTSLLVAEKSRRIGYTWAAAALAVLTAGAQKAAGGMDALYLGPSLDMAREFIDTCAQWARLFGQAVDAVGEVELFDDADKAIKAYRISFSSGFEILALTSRPRSLRGRQGLVIIDEAAFHDDLEEVLKAALALLMWGGKVLVISTHNGDSNPYNQLINDIRAGKRGGAVLRVTIEDALNDGLYNRICLVKGEEWTAEGQQAWLQGILDAYGDAGQEELYCIPRNGGGVWLPRAAVEACASPDVPVLRWKAPDDYLTWPDDARARDVAAWCEAHLAPLLAAADPNLESALGMDYAMEADLSVIWPGQIARDLSRRSLFVLELRQCPFDQQRQILNYILDRLPRWKKAVLDAGGNGAALAQTARTRYGERVEELKLSADWYRLNMPKLKAGIEGRSFVIPKDADIVGDFGMVKMEAGVAKVPRNARTKGSDGKPRHGDAAIAAALFWAGSQAEAADYGYEPAWAADPGAPDLNRLRMDVAYNDDWHDKCAAWVGHGRKGGW